MPDKGLKILDMKPPRIAGMILFSLLVAFGAVALPAEAAPVTASTDTASARTASFCEIFPYFPGCV